jgi:hypothetical protein
MYLNVFCIVYNNYSLAVIYYKCFREVFLSLSLMIYTSTDMKGLFIALLSEKNNRNVYVLYSAISETKNMFLSQRLSSDVYESVCYDSCRKQSYV